MNPTTNEPGSVETTGTRTGARTGGLRDTGRVDMARRVRHPDHPEANGLNVPGPERVASGALGSFLVLRGIARRSWGGLALMALGAALVKRGATGRCEVLAAVGADTRDLSRQSSNPLHRRVRGRASIGVQAELAQVQAAWREQANLPVFLDDLDDGRSQSDQLWDAELVKDVDGTRLAWRSLSGDSPGYNLELSFSELPAGRGTRVDLELDYLPENGVLGAVADRLRMHGPRQRAFEALRRSKRMIELGSIPSIEGQSRGQCATASNDGRSYL